MTATDEADRPEPDATKTHATPHAADRQRILNRLRRMEGQVRGVQRMVEEDAYCIDVLTQLSAVISAARGVGLAVLEDHIRGCVLGTCRHGHGHGHGHGHADRDEMAAELIEAIERFTKTVG